MPRQTDTTPEAERVLCEALRRMSFGQRWRRMRDLYRTARALHAAGVRDRDPSATPERVAAAWRATVPGLPPHLASEASMTAADDNLAVVEHVLAALTRLGIPYALGGSWASSLHGKPRFTHDADLCVEPFSDREAAFCAAFGPDYYVSPSAVTDANLRRSSFNVLHTPSGFKVDVFVRKDRPFDASVMSRRRAFALSEPGREVVCVTAEDVVLLKLEWYRLGGETSDRQWQDVLGVLQVQANRLDDAYLDRWAADLGVSDLLRRARQDAAGPA